MKTEQAKRKKTATVVAELIELNTNMVEGIKALEAKVQSIEAQIKKLSAKPKTTKTE